MVIYGFFEEVCLKTLQNDSTWHELNSQPIQKPLYVLLSQTETESRLEKLNSLVFAFLLYCILLSNIIVHYVSLSDFNCSIIQFVIEPVHLAVKIILIWESNGFSVYVDFGIRQNCFLRMWIWQSSGFTAYVDLGGCCRN